MPGIPLVVREASYSRSTGEMCRQDSQLHLSAEEELVAEESLSIYCKPVEFYNILQRRSIKNPSFLQRCLSYKIQEKHKKRVQMTVTLSGTINHGMQAHSPFPLYVLLARLGSEVTGAEYRAVYRYSRACVLTSFMGSGDDGRAQANFILPEINKLESDAKSGSLGILLLCPGGTEKSAIGIDLSKYQLDLTSFIQNAGGSCLLGKIPFESLCLTWDKSPNLKLGQRAEATLSIEVHPCQIKIGALDEDKYISVEAPTNFETVNSRRYMRVVVSAEVVGAKDRSPYSSYMSSAITSSSSSLSHIIRLRAGNVIFNYRYYNNKLQRTEVTEDFTCPFCLVKCASFKGLRCHLSSSHDLFDFEFWVTEEYQAVNVFVRTDVWKSEVIADAGDPKLQTIFMCLKPLRRKRSTNQIIRHVKSQFLELPTGISDLQNRADDAHSSRGDKARVSGVASGTGQSYVDAECVQSVCANNLAPPAMLQFAKTRKLSFERAEPRNRLLLQKRQFFHSHRAQPMAKEQVMSDRDSEDEVDDDVADFEDRRMLDDFVDVTKDEKQIMHLWNSFVRKQRVLADGHIPWACEAFSGLHGPDFVKSPALIWCWRLLMIKLWNHGLLDGRSMNNCNLILEQCQKQQQQQQQQQQQATPPDSEMMRS